MMRCLRVCLWVAAVGCLLCVPALFLPLSVYDSLADMLGTGPLPAHPVVPYSVRVLFATWGAAGVFLVILALDPMKYGILVPFSGVAAVFLGAVCAISGLGSGLRLWWFVGDALACAVLGILMLLFWRRVKCGPRCSGEPE